MDKEKGLWSEGVDGALAKTSSAPAETQFGTVTPEKLAAPSASPAHGVTAVAGCRTDGDGEAFRRAAQLATWKVKVARLQLNPSAPVKKPTGDPTGLKANDAPAWPSTASARPELRLERAAGVSRQNRED